MRKKIVAVLLVALLTIVPVTGLQAQSKETLNVWSFTDEVPGMIEVFMEEHPEYSDKYDLNITIIATTDGAYQPAIDQALMSGGADAPDIYAAEAAFVMKYTQGEASQFAMPYADLGIDVDAKIEEAGIAQYSVDIGTNPDGNVVGLGFQATGGALIYRRSIAMDVWGTDDPAEVEEKIGPGWDKFYEAAHEMKDSGYSMLSSTGDIWHVIENSSEQPWVVDGELVIDEKRESYLDHAKRLYDEELMNDTTSWEEGWFADMKGEGEREVFAFFGPAWLINYVMASNSGGSAVGEGTYGDWAVCNAPEGFFWGGTWILANKDTTKTDVAKDLIEWITLDTSEEGLQYRWANGTFAEDSAKDSVASATVMEKSNGELDFLGDQDMFEVFVPANEFANGKNLTPYDELINSYWQDQVNTYKIGEKSREQAIDDFKQMVEDNLDIVVNWD